MILELGRGGVPYMVDGPGEDAFESRWLTLPVELFLGDRAPDEPPVTIEIRTGNEPMLIETADGGVRTRPGTVDDPDAVLTGPPQLVLGLLSGRLDRTEAGKGGLKFEGDPKALERLLPKAAVAA